MEQVNQAMSASDTQRPDEICRMWNGKPLSEHGAFEDIQEHQRILSMGGNALKGIGALLIPLTDANDTDTEAKRSELADLFMFFGEIMADRSRAISDAVFRIEEAANGKIR